MNASGEFLNPSEAARRLGVSTKALRLYEKRGLITPLRTTAGWRTYGPKEMARAAEVVSLRELNLSLAEVAGVMAGDPEGLEPALAAHQVALEGRIDQLAGSLEKLRALRAKLAMGQMPAGADLVEMLRRAPGLSVAFDLPWPWGGERFELCNIQPLTYITGPLGSGKTRLARNLAGALPGAAFLGLERLADDGAEARSHLDRDPALKSKLERAMAWLLDEGAVTSTALMTLLVHLEAEASSPLVIDMIEQDLDQSSQEALSSYLRRRGPDARPLFMLTRSCALLDVASVGPDETIILCPANHSPPIQVAPYPGAAGYEALTSCLASPDVRARTVGVIALKPQQA